MGKRIQRENTSGVDINQKIVAQMWSGGKDSTCAGIKHLERGDKVHFICYIPMFDADIPLIEKCHWDFQMQMAFDFCRDNKFLSPTYKKKEGRLFVVSSRKSVGATEVV